MSSINTPFSIISLDNTSKAALATDIIGSSWSLNGNPGVSIKFTYTSLLPIYINPLVTVLYVSLSISLLSIKNAYFLSYTPRLYAELLAFSI